jgi:hypothetical protein
LAFDVKDIGPLTVVDELGLGLDGEAGPDGAIDAAGDKGFGFGVELARVGHGIISLKNVIIKRVRLV